MSRKSLAILLMLACGCSRSGGGKDDGTAADPWDDAVRVALLEPFQGSWTYDFDRTADIRRSQGIPAEQIEKEQEFRRRNPSLAELGTSLTFDGHLATGDPFPFSEYGLFGLHEHDGAVCGKAWHHEDANDPGDMSKCFVKLRRVGEELHFDLWMPDGQTDLGDPDLNDAPAVVSGSAAECEAPPDDGDDRNGWMTRVFVRASS